MPEDRETATSQHHSRPGEEHLRLIADSLPFLVSYIDADQRYRFANRTYEVWFGQPRDEVRGKTMAEVLGPAAFATIEPHVRTALAGQAVTFEASVAYRHGGERAVRATYVPHVAGDRVVGMVALVADVTAEKSASRERDTLVVSEHQARTHAEAALARVGRLQQLTALLSETADLEEIYKLAVTQVIAATGAQAASLALLREPAPDGSGDRRPSLDGVPSSGVADLELVFSQGYPEEMIQRWRRFSVTAATPMSQAVRTGTAIFVESQAKKAERYPNLAATTDTNTSAGLQALAAIPLLVHGRAIGGLGLSFATSRSFSAEDQQHLTSIAQQCAQAIARSQLFAAERQARAEAEAARGRLVVLADASAAFTRATPDPGALFQTIARKITDFPGDCCSIWLVADDGEMLEHTAFHHRDAAAEAAVRALFTGLALRVGEGLTGRVAQTGVSVRLSTLDPQQLRLAVKAELRHLLERYPARSLMFVPLKNRDRVLGVLVLARFDSPRPYSFEDQRLVEDLADRAAMAVETSRLIEKERRAVRARDDFLSIAGHELRTPLTALQLQVQSLLQPGRAKMDEKSAARVAKMEQHTARVTRLVEELLDVARITGGRLQLLREPVDLPALITEVTERFPEAMARARCTLTVEVDGGPQGSIIGLWDRTRLDQVLTNLLDNARKYGAGKPIQVRARRRADHARVEVVDQGIGIPAADQRRIFGRFERAVSERNYGGLGLGLWISRQMIEAMGGTIWFESVEGKGSTFVVEIPLAPPAAVVAKEARAQAATNGSTTVR